MSKAITTPAHITSISSRQDGSLRFSTETPELTTDEKVAFMELQGKNLHMLIQPEDADEVLEVEQGLETKTPSERLRSVLYVLYKQRGTDLPFRDWYEGQMESIIDVVKGKLDE